ncbi:hydrogenase maturation protease [bacterium]|nr:hydrogenase maturation protease [bacterium]
MSLDGIEKIFDEVAEFIDGNWAILGIGNRLRGDDAFGSILAEKLRERFRNSVFDEKIFDGSSAPENYFGKLIQLKCERVLVIDAIIYDAPAGELKIFVPEQLSSPMISTHGPSNFNMMQIAMPETRIKILAVEPKNLGIGEPMSEEVISTLNEVKIALENILKDKT